MCELAAEGVGGDVVDERALAADLDDGDPLAIALLERGIAGDVHLGELEAQLCLETGERLPRPLAKVAILSRVEEDGRYG